MNWGESLRISLDSIVQHKLRSSLTLLGVIIGVVTIIATMSIIKGLQNMMEREMSELSAGVFQVQRYESNVGIQMGGRRRKPRPKIGMTEVRALEKNVPLAQIVAPEVHKYRVQARFKNEETPSNILVFGGTSGSVPNNGKSVEYGRSITEQDLQYARRVVIIGSAVALKIFPFRNPVGEFITLNGQRAQVIGVFEESGSMFNSNSDYQCYIPITTFQNWWGTERGWVITVKSKKTELMDEAIEQTIAAMRSARGLKPGEENNFAIWNSEQLVDSFNQMTKWIRIAALGIASIALLVAGIGIMNIMLVSVTERTREIGVRKALGARRSSILGQFLVEAVILTEIGAVLGVIIGAVASLALGQAANLPVAIPLWSVVVGIGFCSVIGVVFGTWPAWKASRLDPIEALRYE